MTLEPVQSSNIKAIGYEPATSTLAVQFHSGTTHEYAGVTPAEHAAFMAAPSKGKHFHKHIRAKG
jgi:hypothetical protein